MGSSRGAGGDADDDAEGDAAGVHGADAEDAVAIGEFFDEQSEVSKHAAMVNARRREKSAE